MNPPRSPNLVGPLAVAATCGVAEAFVLEGAKLVSILKSMPWIWIPPGFMFAITILRINIMGDGLRDVLDPRATLLP